MNIPAEKTKKWISSLHEAIDLLHEDVKAIIMKSSGSNCATDIIALSEMSLGFEIKSIEDLVEGWNLLRKSKKLTGVWQFDNGYIKGTFSECGCPLVRSGLIQLHPVQCLCSKGMMETIFSKVSKKDVEVVIRQSIGKGDKVCEFVIYIK